MKKRILCLLLAATMAVTANVNIFAAEMSGTAENIATPATVEENTDNSADTVTDGNGENAEGTATAPAAGNEAEGTTDSTGADSNAAGTNDAAVSGTVTTDTTTTESAGTTDSNITSNVTVDNTANAESDVTANVIVDENNDDVEITEDDKPYLALGADLTEEQKNTVLALMGIDPASLGDYDVTYITNAEEHQYLDAYVDASKIGTRSLSSVVIVEREKGSGLNISTSNINFCTVGMYKNALTTAGVTDADIIVAGPTPISGTAALVGIFKAYQDMTGETIEEDVIDAALNELVLTGELADILDGYTNEEIEEFIAYIKAVVAENDLKDADSINAVIDEACEKYGVTLNDTERQQIVDLLLKITSLGIDLSGLVDYAESLYNSYKNGGSTGGISGVFTAIGDFFSNIFTSIADFFKNLFE